MQGSHRRTLSAICSPLHEFGGGALELRHYKSIDTKDTLGDAGDINSNSSRPETAVSMPASPARAYSRGRGSPLTGYDTDPNSGSYNNLSSGTSYYSCVSQITIGFEVKGPVSIGISHWKPPYIHKESYHPYEQSQHNPDVPATPVSCSFLTQMDLSASLSCPTSLSIIPTVSRSSSQDTLSEDSEANQDFLDVFSKNAAESLPPHRPCDCPIDLIPGKRISRGRVFPLALPESQTMVAYISENLECGFIH
ncbi:uncharacterized protein LOC142150790 [Mixophyes fleayi]|uniref:uncharacterized protein LOC142150790 n=1 Tax=Mixophyes fleayi TaxID=3061075 RepID=UPI003F4D84CA